MVTGAGGGLGLETSVVVARAGGWGVMVGRSPLKLAGALDDVRRRVDYRAVAEELRRMAEEEVGNDE